MAIIQHAGSDSIMVDMEENSKNSSNFLIAGSSLQPHSLRHRLLRPIPVTIILATIVCMTYSAYHRIGTVANADVVEFTQNVAGGYFALGKTEDQPGFIVLSEIDQNKANVYANQSVNFLTGTHTYVSIELQEKLWSTRLRKPVVILIDKNAHVEYHTINWTLEDFSDMQHAVDCSHAQAILKKRCGQPFTDFHEAFSARGPGFIPAPLRSFLLPYTDRRAKTSTP